MAADKELLDEIGVNLTDQQILFCREFIIDLNATQAAIRAGYTEKSAQTNSYRLIANPKITAFIERLKRDRMLRMQIESDQVIAQVGRLAFSDLRNLYGEEGELLHIKEIDDDTAAAIESIKTFKKPSGEFDDDGNPIYVDVFEYKLADKKGSLALLGKHLALFTDKTETAITHSGQVKIIKVPVKEPRPDADGNRVEAPDNE